MSLVEMMVGMVVGMFVVAVMGMVYLGTRSTYTAQESGTRLQENGRYAVETLANDIRMSGFRGCQGSEAVNNTLNSPTALLYNYGEPIWGARYTGAGWSPALASPADGLGALPAGDVLVIRRPSGLGWSLIGAMTSTSDALTISATADFTQGDLLMVADCASASVLQATNAGPGAAGSLAHLAGAGGVLPGVSGNALLRAYAHDARVWRLQTRIYHLGASLRRPGETALWVYQNPVYDGGSQHAELVTGVERLAVTYGVDTNGDLAADRYRSADQVGNWAQVVNARIELLLAGGSTGKATQAQPYVFGGETVTPTDTRLRTVMSTVVSLRNALP